MKTSSSKMLITQLVEFGLSDKEAKVYLALLELEVAGVTEVAETANINRSSTYVVLSSLKKKGLVSTSEDKKIQHYIAVSPEMLFREAEDRANQAEKIKKTIDNIIPELKALHKDTKQRPKIKIFEGSRGFINAFEDTLDSKEKVIRVFSNGQRIFNKLPEYFPNYVQRRIKLGIKMHGIHPDNKIGRHLIKTSPKFDQPMLISFKMSKFPADMAIYDNKIGYMSPDQDLALIIESKEIASVMKNIFDLAFNEAKRLNRNRNNN